MGTAKSVACAVLVVTAVFAGGAARAASRAGDEPGIVSADLLRHPVSGKVRKLLLRAIAKSDSGEHEEAIGQLREILGKYPESAPYAQNLLGVEYVRTGRFADAVGSFERAVAWLPHDAMTHYNFGLALICAGDYQRARQEVRRALELDPNNAAMRVRLNALGERDHARP